MTGSHSIPESRPRHARAPGDIDEPALMAAVASGRMDAFETLYRIYQPRLQRFIGGITRRPAQADEILDDTMMVVWRKAQLFREGARVSTWIFAIAYRQSLKALQRFEGRLEFHPELEAAGGGDPEALHQHGELRSGLDRALRQLSAEQRAAIELTYYWGHSCAEVAEILQCPVDTVKTRMYYGRRRLKELLGAEWRGTP
jgi:RNA polymerase sigma factor (sigma-70 family)